MPGPRLPTRSPATGWPIAAALAVLAIVLYAVRYALLPFVIALAIAFLVEPAVHWLNFRLGKHRWPGAILLYLSLLGLFAATAYWIGGAVIGDVAHLIGRAPTIAHGLISKLIGPHGVELLGHRYTPDMLVQQIGAWIAGALGTGAAMRAVGLGVGALIGGFLLLVLLPYFMVSGPRLAAGAIWLIPPERRASVERLLPRITPVLRRYLLGVLLVVAYTSFVAWIGFGPVFGLPHAVLLALAVGILEIIPAVGPIASATLIGITGFQQNTLSELAMLVGFAVLLRLSIDNLVGPIVLGQAARVHPVVVIFSFMVGAMLFGIIGLILAVPTAVCIKIILQQYYAEPIADTPRRNPMERR